MRIFHENEGLKGRMFHGVCKTRGLRLYVDGSYGYPASMHFRLPPAHYVRAHLPFAFAKTGETNVTQVSLAKASVGFYTLDVSLDDASGAEILRHEARFAVLPKAGRMTAKRDSPYCTWWFNSHSTSGTTADANGPVMQRAGIRKVSSYLPTPEQCETYDIVFCGDFTGIPPKQEFDQIGSGRPMALARRRALCYH